MMLCKPAFDYADLVEDLLWVQCDHEEFQEARTSVYDKSLH